MATTTAAAAGSGLTDRISVIPAWATMRPVEGPPGEAQHPSGLWLAGQRPVDRILVAQGGGPTRVINQSLVGVVDAGLSHGFQVYGARHSLEGILAEDMVDFGHVPDSELRRVAETPSAALGTSRAEIPQSDLPRVLDVLKAHKINSLFYIGGNGSAHTVHVLSEMAQADGYPLHCFHVPKTVDNDLEHSDHTPGFASAASFVAKAFAGFNHENRALPGVMVAVVMGRDSGFLTAASTLARQRADDGPHVVCLPEREFVMSDFLAAVQAAYAQYGRCVVAVAEGIRDANGPVAAQMGPERCGDGRPQLTDNGELGGFLAGVIKRELGISRVRCNTLGHVQRSYAEDPPPVDRREAYQVGAAAVEFSMAGHTEGSVAIRRVPNEEYAAEYALVRPSDVAGRTRLVPGEFIGADRFSVTAALGTYLRPLVGPMPETGRLDAPGVPKLLHPS